MLESIERILATTDLSEPARRGLEEAANLARSTGAHLTIFYVAEDDLPPIIVGMPQKEREALLATHAERARTHLEEQVSTPHERLEIEVVLRQGRPGREIVNFAAEHDIDLIVMASAGRGALGEIFLGSTTRNVLHGARCPVLVVPVRDGS